MSTTITTILVTGGNSGFGRLIVETLARQGAHVFAGMRDPGGKNTQAAAELRTLAEQDHLALDIVSLDVTDDTSGSLLLRIWLNISENDSDRGSALLAYFEIYCKAA